MFLVRVVCSDPECFEEREIVVDDLDEVDTEICGCDHGFVIVAVGSG